MLFWRYIRCKPVHYIQWNSQPLVDWLGKVYCPVITLAESAVGTWWWTPNLISNAWSENRIIANIRTVNHRSIHFNKKNLNLPIFVYQELNDGGGGPLLGQEPLFEWIQYRQYRFDCIAIQEISETDNQLVIKNFSCARVPQLHFNVEQLVD